jgi:hypothetical protein
MSTSSDFSKPLTTDTYVNVTAEVNALATDLAKGLDPATTTPVNLPTNAVRWNSANGYWEKFTGTTWSALASIYNIVASKASKLSTAVTLAINGDVSGSTSFDGSSGATIVATLPNVNANAGTAGSATTIPVITTNAKGQVTAVTPTAISFPTSPVTSVFGRTGAVTLGSSDVTGALGYTPNPTLGFTPVQQGGGTGQGSNKLYLGWSGSQLGLQVDSTNFGTTWPISINGDAATVGGLSASSFSTSEYVNQSFSLFQTFGSLSAGANRSVGYGYAIWSSGSGTQGGRGVYYSNLFYLTTTGSGKSASTIQVNVGNCRVMLWNFSTTKSMQINLTAVINFASDDSYGFQIRQNGTTVASFGAYTARGIQTYNFGSFTVPANSTVTFDLYGSILGGSGIDAIYVNSFTATYIQFV